ncbi:MAG: hypothetical protein ABL955_08255 [Elusimicrobiota bacterium]
MVRTLACATAGVILAYAGFRLIKRFETPAERTGFHTTDWPHVCGYGGGYVLLFLGLYLLMIQTPMFWILHSR